MRARRLLCILIVLLWPGAAIAAGDPGVLENLRYQVGLGPWNDVARANLSLKQTGPDQYQAEFSVAPQGLWAILSRWLPQRYYTEMVFRQGRLQPRVFREELQIKGEHIVKEYRFDYENGKLEYWRQVGNRPMTGQGLYPLKGAVYDPLTLFYSFRTGAMGPRASGETLRVQLIPNPEPVEMVIRFGPEAPEGRKVMVTLQEAPSGQESDPYFCFVTPEWVLRLGWIRVLRFGKLAGSLQNPGEISHEGILAFPAAPSTEAPQ